jgi:hypothetical protein
MFNLLFFSFLESQFNKQYSSSTSTQLAKPEPLSMHRADPQPSALGAAQVSPARKRWESYAKRIWSAVGATQLWPRLPQTSVGDLAPAKKPRMSTESDNSHSESPRHVPSRLICSFSYPCSRAHRSKGIVASSSTTGTASPYSSNQCFSDTYGTCRRRPPSRAQFPAPNKTPSAALALLHTLDNIFFEIPTHARTTCKSAIFSLRRLHFARRPRSVSRRTTGKSKGFHPQSQLPGGQQDIRRTVEEKSTPTVDLNRLSRGDRRPGPLRCRSPKWHRLASLCQKSSIARCHPPVPFAAGGSLRERHRRNPLDH